LVDTSRLTFLVAEKAVLEIATAASAGGHLGRWRLPHQPFEAGPASGYLAQICGEVINRAFLNWLSESCAINQAQPPCSNRLQK
jgi:hypothetical protein